MSGKKKGKLINWKCKEVKINKSKTNNIDKKSDDLNEESELLSNLKLNEIELESDDEEIEIDEEIQIEGIVYEQAMVDSNICLYKDGINVATWDGKNNNGALVGSGVYVYQLEVGDVRIQKKMMLLK